MGKPPKPIKGAPIVDPASFKITSPVALRDVVGVMSASESPSAWRIRAGNESGCFFINNSGVISVLLADTLNALTSDTTFSLTIEATNRWGAGTGSGTVTIAMGTIIVLPADEWTTRDGRSGAVSGAAQYPHLLDGYPDAAHGGPPNARVRAVNGSYALVPPTGTRYQPPWMVAGVDYKVGYNGALPSKNPGDTGTLNGDSGVNGKYDATQLPTILWINQPNAIVDGYNFDRTSAGGTSMQLIIDAAATGCVVKNCNFKLISGGAGGPFRVFGNNCLIQYCVIDGNGAAGNFSGGIPSDINFAVDGNITFEYCWLLNGWQQLMDASYTTVGVNITARYNLFDECGLQAGAHGDWIILIGQTGSTSTVNASFNTCKAQVTGPSGGPLGFSVFVTTTPNLPQCSNFTVNNNTMIAGQDPPGTNLMSTMMLIDKTLVSAAFASQNFIDNTGVGPSPGAGGQLFYSALDSGTSPNGGPLTGTFTHSSNILMTTGGSAD